VTVHGVRVSWWRVMGLHVQTLWLQFLVADARHIVLRRRAVSNPNHYFKPPTATYTLTRAATMWTPSNASRSIPSAWCCHLDHVVLLRHSIQCNYHIPYPLHSIVKIFPSSSNFPHFFPTILITVTELAPSVKNTLKLLKYDYIYIQLNALLLLFKT
jgi:hypothetical protein